MRSARAVNAARAMKKPLAISAGAALLLAPALAAAQAVCDYSQVTLPWSAPTNVSPTAQNAPRWRTDAVIRLAFTGDWCPAPEQFELVLIDKQTGADLEAVPAQLRFHSTTLIVENEAPGVNLIDINPSGPLEPSSEYKLTVTPPNPASPIYEEYQLRFRTSNRGIDPLDPNAFAGITSAEVWGDRCEANGPFEALDETPGCNKSSRVKIRIQYTPIDRPDVAYAAYRVSSQPLDLQGNPTGTLDETEILFELQPGAKDQGVGLAPRFVTARVPYFPQPRRDCFEIRLLDEWGRERGGVGQRACADMNMDSDFIRLFDMQEEALQQEILNAIAMGSLPWDPCPDGCEGDQCMFGFPPPNPFETNDPIPGISCDNVGLNGGDPDREPPPIVEPGADSGPDDPKIDAAAGGDDAGTRPDGGGEGDGGGKEDSGGGGGGCAIAPQPSLGVGLLALLALLALGAWRRRHPA